MIRVRVLSDVHLEFGALDLRPAGEDVVALCGDIGLFTDGVQWADRLAGKLGVPVVMIAGNHEFYRHSEHGAPASVEQILGALSAAARLTGGRVTFLSEEAAVVAGVRFVGATLWTDFALFGDAARAMAAAEVRMNDYRLIYRTPAERLHPSDTSGMHEAARLFLEAELSRPHDGPTVVMTHHPPSGRSIAGRYAEMPCPPPMPRTSTKSSRIRGRHYGCTGIRTCRRIIGSEARAWCATRGVMRNTNSTRISIRTWSSRSDPRRWQAEAGWFNLSEWVRPTR